MTARCGLLSISLHVLLLLLSGVLNVRAQTTSSPPSSPTTLPYSPPSSPTTLIQCISDHATQRCFSMNNVAKTWSDAEAACLQDGSLLAVLKTDQEDAILKRYLQQTGGDMDPESTGFRAWVGGRESNNDTEWRWVHDRNQVNASVPPFKFISEPKVYQDCGSISVAGSDVAANQTIKLGSRHCRAALNFICVKKIGSPPVDSDISTACSIGAYKGLLYDGLCYAIYGNDRNNYKQSWTKAERSCLALGAELAYFTNLTQDAKSAEFINALLGGLDQTFWLGFRRRPWIWVVSYNASDSRVLNSSAMTSTNWLPDTLPALFTMACMAAGAYADNQYGWTDENCDTPLPYICEKLTLITTTVPPTTNTVLITTPLLSNVTREQSNETEDGEIPTQHKNGTHAHFWEGGDQDADFGERIRDWAYIIIPCAMIVLIIIAALISVVCYFRQKRKGYNVA